MVFSATLRSATVAAAILSSSVFADLGKPVLFSDGLSPHVDASFWANLPATQSTNDQWAAGTIPQNCLTEATNGGFAGADFEVYNVNYGDCGMGPWVFCRHTSADISATSMIDLFGRLPVHERQWVKNVIAVPGGGSAYMSNGIVVFQGPVGTPSVFQHETGHAVDFYARDTQSSATTEWTNAEAADSCVPDGYANSNYVEDYTQVSVLSLYDIVTPGGLDAIGADWHCLENQKNVLDGFQRTDSMVLGGECTRRWSDSPIVSTSSKRGELPEPNLKATQENNVFDIPFEARTEVHTFKNLVFNHTEEANAINRIAKWQKAAGKV